MDDAASGAGERRGVRGAEPVPEPRLSPKRDKPRRRGIKCGILLNIFFRAMRRKVITVNQIHDVITKKLSILMTRIKMVKSFV